MIRKLKTLGLALLAVAAIGAVSASAAMALTPKLKVGTGDGNIDGSQIGNILRTVGGGRTMQCETITFTASLAEATAEVKNIVPRYESCSSTLAGLKVPMTITVNGCTYTINVGATTGADTYAATTDIVCPAGKSIEYHVYKEGIKPAEHVTANQICGYTVGPQTGLGSLTLTNNTASSPKDIEVTLSLSGIKYKKTLGTIPICGAAESTETRTGKATFRGTTTTGVSSEVQIVEV